MSLSRRRLSWRPLVRRRSRVVGPGCGEQDDYDAGDGDGGNESRGDSDPASPRGSARSRAVVLARRRAAAGRMVEVVVRGR